MGQLSGRSIRSFVLRQGRLTEGQQRSLDDYWSVFGIDVGKNDSVPTAHTPDSNHKDKQHQVLSPVASQVVSATPSSVIDRPARDGSLDVERIDLAQHFEQSAPVWMEIGFGNGDALTYMAARNPAANFLGVEVHLPGVGHALGAIASEELTNVRLIRYDVLDLIEHYLTPGSLNRVLIFFPDPWHKTKHHKRRLVNSKFLDILAPLLESSGLIHFASDWVPYAKQVRALVDAHPRFECLPDDEYARTVAALRPETHFERRGLKLGHKVTDLVIRKIST